MKNLFFILLSISLFTACDNEPIDRAIINNQNNDDDGGGNTSDDPLALNAYSLDLDSELPFVGNFILNTDFSFNANNLVNGLAIETVLIGQSINENVTLSRNNAGQITGNTSVSSGIVTNETTVTYSGNNISQIVYNYVGDDEDDYTYNFEYSGNTITRTQVNSTISTIFTLNGSNQFIRKESFDGNTSIKLEVVDYDGLGNCISSISTGEDATTATFGFDTNENPLNEPFRDQYLLTFLNDDYLDEIGSPLAHFFSPNNWSVIETPAGIVNFTIEYDDADRITSRNGTYDFGDGITISQSETFQFVN